MVILFGFMLLVAIYILYKLFIDGILFKLILFFFGWFGLYTALKIYVEGATKTAFTIGVEHPISFSWAVAIPTAICLLAMLCSRTNGD
jgi:hypothetical protein